MGLPLLEETPRIFSACQLLVRKSRLWSLLSFGHRTGRKLAPITRIASIALLLAYYLAHGSHLGMCQNRATLSNAGIHFRIPFNHPAPKPEKSSKQTCPPADRKRAKAATTSSCIVHPWVLLSFPSMLSKRTNVDRNQPLC